MDIVNNEVNCGDNMVTFSGRYVNPWAMRPEDIDIEDIAQGLSNNCRFSGQCRTFYSVAQHSTLMAWEIWKDTVSDQLALIALLHDAPEAYINDIVRCVKAGLPAYRDLEQVVWKAVCDKFNLGLWVDVPGLIHRADMRMLVTERICLISEKSAVWDLQKQFLPYDFKINSEHPKLARKNFLFAFNTFTKNL